MKNEIVIKMKGENKIKKKKKKKTKLLINRR